MKSQEKLEQLRQELLEKRQEKCTFNPKINSHSRKIFGEYQKQFRKRRSLKPAKKGKEKRKLTRHKSQANLAKKTYHQMHTKQRKADKRKQRTREAKMEIQNNEYLLEFDRNRRGSVFEHLYRQRKKRESNQLKLFERIQQQECPFRPKRVAKSSAKGSHENFLARNLRFQKKKQSFQQREKAKMKKQMFQPNLHRKTPSRPRKDVHEELYDQRNKENFRRQRLVEKYQVRLNRRKERNCGIELSQFLRNRSKCWREKSCKNWRRFSTCWIQTETE